MEDVTFTSDGLTLSGILHLPERHKDGDTWPCIVVMHGFGGHKSGPAQLWSAPQYTDWGYAVLRFDFRGCGDSEGPKGRVIPQEEIADARAALAYVAARPEVDAERIAFSGTSYGAIVSVCAAAVDPLAKAVIAQGGWGNSRNWYRFLHPPGPAWEKFEAMLERGHKARDAGDEPELAHRFDIVPIPEHLRANIDGPSAFDFHVETAIETLAFNPEEHIAAVAPRPILLLHSIEDDVVPSSGSIELYNHAKKNAELYILADVDHFMFGEDNPRVIRLVKDWLDRFFPAS